jgi:hypothetical protein
MTSLLCGRHRCLYHCLFCRLTLPAVAGAPSLDAVHTVANVPAVSPLVLMAPMNHDVHGVPAVAGIPAVFGPYLFLAFLLLLPLLLLVVLLVLMFLLVLVSMLFLASLLMLASLYC